MKKNLSFVLALCLSFAASISAKEAVIKISVNDLHKLCTTGRSTAEFYDKFEGSEPLCLIITDKKVDSEKFIEALKEGYIGRPTTLDLQNVTDSTKGFSFEYIYSNIVEVIFPEKYPGYHFDTVKSIEKIRLSRTQRTINMDQFRGLPKLKEIEIPEGSELQEICWYAFHWTPGPEKINIPPSCKVIGSQVFMNRKKISDLDLSHVERIEKEAFSGCDGLERITLGEKFTDFGSAFTNCKNLKEITILNPNIKFSKGGFAGCENLEKINLPEGCPYVVENGVMMENFGRKILFVFANNQNNTVRIPDSVVAIDTGAFGTNGGIKKITNIPDLYKMDKVFSGCTSLEEVEYKADVKYPGGFRAFEKCSNLKKFTFPKGTREFGSYLFAECTSLDNVVLPEGLIYPDQLESWANERYSGTFYKCTGLKNVQLPKDIPAIYASMFSLSGLEKITIPDSVTKIYMNAFYNCESLSEVQMSKNLVELRQSAFIGCKSLKKLELPPTLEIIGDEALKNCENLSALDIPESVKEIGSGFIEGTQIKEINIPLSVKKISTSNFKGATSLKTIHYEGTAEDFMNRYSNDGNDEEDALDIRVICSDKEFNLLQLTKFYTTEELRKL